MRNTLTLLALVCLQAYADREARDQCPPNTFIQADGACVADEPFCHVEVLTVDAAPDFPLVYEEQCWTDQGRLPPGHWNHFSASTHCPPDYYGICDGRYTCIKGE